MYIDREVTPWLVLADESLSTALAKIGDNKGNIIFVVNETGELAGSLSDGDFRRWLMRQGAVDLSRPVAEAMNPHARSLTEVEARAATDALFQGPVTRIPVVDARNRVVAVARAGRPAVRLAGHVIDASAPCFFVAEIGNNHQGDLKLAKRLINEAAAAGAQCAKFQMRSMDSLYRQSLCKTATEDLGAEYTMDLLSRFQLSDDDLFRAFDHCGKKGLVPLCTPFDLTSLDKLVRFGLPGLKIASADLTNHDLLLAAAESGLPIICSTGMSEDAEIEAAVDILRGKNTPFILLHCNSTYPAPFKDLHLHYMRRLAEMGGCPVGYSGHERGTAVALAAVALGADLVEKHFTVNKFAEGVDHKVSLLPHEFRLLVEGAREIEAAMSRREPTRRMSQGEAINRENLAKSLVVNRDVAKGEYIRADMIVARSPGKGLPPSMKSRLIGLPARRDMRCGDFFYKSDLFGPVAAPRDFSFGLPWGLPVRFHDFRSLTSPVRPDFVEFHLSYRDLDVDLDTVFAPGERFPFGFTLHCPELFENDHLLDLCTADVDYRSRSVAALNRVARLARRLQAYFPAEKRPRIVVNAGGFSFSGPLTPPERAPLYALFGESLAQAELEGVEVLPQTMPPFPWHFGGQRFHNLFVDAREIVEVCTRLGLSVCLDVSHSKLACNHAGQSFASFLEQVCPLASHLHLADAEGIDGEGLQIGEGDIDFAVVAEKVRISCPGASFIPEVWQGHAGDGEGFWLALDRLEPYLGGRSQACPKAMP